MSTDNFGPKIDLSPVPATPREPPANRGFVGRVTLGLGHVVRSFDWLFTPFRSHLFYCKFERPTRWLVGNPLLSGQIALYVGIAWGIVGSGLGLTDLFWNEVRWDQFLVGVATSWLFGTVLFVNVLLRGFPPDRLPDSPTEKDWSPRVYASLFPSCNPGVRRVGKWMLWWLLGLGLIVYLGKIVAILAGPHLHKEATDVAGVWEFLIRVEDFLTHNWAFGIGYVSGFLAAYLLSLLDAAIELRETIARQWWLTYVDELKPCMDEPTPPIAPKPGQEGYNKFYSQLLLHAMALVLGFAILCVLAAIVLWIILFKKQSSPAVILSLILMLLDVVGGLIAFRVRGARTFALLFFLWVMLVNSQSCVRYKMTYPNVDDNAYDCARGLDLTKYEQYRKRAPADGGLINGKDLLEQFQKNWQDPENKGKPSRTTKPRLIVVAVSGGGIRAAVWTAVVLEGLEAGFPGGNGKAPLRDHLRIFAGASGGMVGAGAYAADFHNGPLQTTDRDDATGLFPLSKALAEDSLSPIVQTMLVNDFTLSALVPLRSRDDRGRTLEKVWKDKVRGRGERHQSPFEMHVRDLRALEATCKRPSLIFAPIMVEDSKRLLISNLDLDHLTEPRGNRLDKLNGPGIDSLARPCVEFFRLFPEATNFEVGTAARMSATFPVVSPAVGIPVYPPRRVVDAGYFDNYGIDVLANWLLHHQTAVRDNTSGVLLIEIRAYPLEDGGQNFSDLPQSPADSIVGAVSAPLQALTTARSWAAFHRNNELLAEVHRVFNAAPRPSDFFTTVTFEQKKDAALSWYLTTRQKREVVDGFFARTEDGWVVQDDKNDPRWNVKKKLSEIDNWFGTGGK